MKLSINWLKNFLPLDGTSSKEVASKLTMGAFEVEDIQAVGPKFRGPVLIGEILEIEKHPNADRLLVTKVTTDGKNKFQIICGAKNIKVGQRVPVCLPGAVVINRKDGSELHIKRSKIREIESFGMLCAASELGLPQEEQDEILILPQDAKLGQSIIDYLSLNEDTVLEVASRSNRGDALSVFGLSKEISALIKKKTKELSFKTPKFDNSVKNILSKIENPKDTFLFYTATIQNIKVTDSPQWLKRLLESISIRSVNNIVDITNYINFSFGQPMHAYDKEKLKGDFLISRTAKKGEEIFTLDGKKRELKEGILVIADSNGPQAIAGIMGGKDSEVTENTKEIVLEAAVFNPTKVRKSSRTIGLTTDASKRFERSVDSNFTYSALLKAIELIEELAIPDNNKIKVSPVSQAGEPVKKELKIQLPQREVKRVLGINISIKETARLLESLEFKCKLIQDDTIEVLVPYRRLNDISRPIDLIEEVARLYGYDLIEASPPPSTLSAKKTQIWLKKIKGHFLSTGFSEVYLSSLTGEQVLSNKEFTFNKTKAVSMLNPLSREHAILRQSLLPGLLEALKLNLSHQVSSVKLFEIGKAYFLNGVPQEKETGVEEVTKIAGVICGHEENWFTNRHITGAADEFLFFITKGILESFFERNKCQVIFLPNKESFLHPKFSLAVSYDNNIIGSFGCLHPRLEKKFDLKGTVMVFEINFDSIINNLEKIQAYEKISSQPAVMRDITIDLPRKYEANTVSNEVSKVTSGFVQSIKLVSTYDLDKEFRSLTYRLKMQDFEQTLTSKQIDDEVNKIKNHLIACFQAKFRV